MTALVATTVPLDRAPDLLACAGEDGLLFRTHDGGLAGRGVALHIDLPDGLSGAGPAVASALGAIVTNDAVGRPGTGPIAVGALPFDPCAPGHLVVPSVLWGRSGDTGWLTTVGPAASDAGAPAAAPPVGARRGAESPDEFELRPTMSHAEWREVVAAAVEAIGAGELQKVVLARRIDVTANRPFVVTDVLERLSALYPSCMVYSVEGFVGASPELLIRRSGDLIESHPLAGTVARSGDTAGDQALVARLLASPKARREHQVVVEQIAAVLGPVCSTLDAPATPSVMGLRNVSHLATHITGQLSDPAPSALDLVARIHPTPAVGGSPTAEAVDYLQKVEGFDRGRYAGPVGWVDSRGDGTWAVGIRGAELAGRRARIFAGNGIVSGSDPAEELAETQLKLQALLAALVRP